MQGEPASWMDRAADEIRNSGTLSANAIAAIIARHAPASAHDMLDAAGWRAYTADVDPVALDMLNTDRRARASRLAEAEVLLERLFGVCHPCSSNPCDPVTCGINAVRSEVVAFLAARRGRAQG